MNILIKMNGQDVTDSCLLSATRLAYDTSKRITTASITVMGQALAAATGAKYDAAHYDIDRFTAALTDMFPVQILDGRDGVTKLFDGQIYAMSLVQSDAPNFSVWYECSLNDWAAWLDRSVCWDRAFPLTLPNSDQGIILELLGQFCPKIHLTDIAEIVPTIQKFDWATKTCRQVLDELAVLSMGSWRVDFDANLHYQLASAAPAAPFGLSTSPDFVTTFPVRVDGYRHDFTNPINHAYVRGTQDASTGVTIAAEYSDPVSIQTYGEYAAGLVDDQIVTGWDAALKAKSIVLANAYPVETGNFTIWGRDGLECGMQVHLTEENLGIDGDYTIRALAMEWVDQETVQYTAQFGAAQPDLETILRLLDQRTKWKTSNVPVAVISPGPPPDGSVTDASIAPPGLSASSIQSVNASTIQGVINAGQIGSVNANTIIGQIAAGQIQSVNANQIAGVLSASQIGAVNANTIQGSIQSNQIGSVNATTIQGVVVSSQLADQIIDNLAKYAPKLAPIPMVNNVSEIGTLPNDNFPANSYFYYVPDGGFYRITPDGTTWAQDQAVSGSQRFYHVGAISANQIIGLIVAAQIQTITAGQITGSIQAGQIGGVNASVIVGQVNASQIASVNANVIQGAITSAQIQSVTAGQITGTIQGTQIGTIAATQITGTIQGTQIGSINAATITIGQLVDSQIAGMSGAKLSVGSVASDKFNGFSIDVGGAGNMPGRIRVFDGTAAVVGQMGVLTEVGLSAYGGWFKVLGAGGTSYSTAKVYTDTSGNLFLKDADLNIGGGVLTTSPATFDATYSVLAWKATNSPDSASFFSRGLVLYYNGTKIGSVVRSPGGGWMEIECPAAGGAYVLISGNTGVRSDQGYSVGGSKVINSSGQFTGTLTGGVSTSSSITCGSLSATSLSTGGTVNASGGHTGGPFTGSSVNTSGSCTAGSYSVGATTVINTSGQFVGNGVVCSSGISGSGFNPTGFTGQTWQVAFRDASGNFLKLYIDGVDRGFTQLVFKGGVLVNFQ